MNVQWNGGDGTLRTFVNLTSCQYYSGDYFKKKIMCWPVAWMGRGILWFLVGKREGKDHLKVLGIDGRIILNGSARNCSISAGISVFWVETFVRLLRKP